jgi:hypothetical protein
MVSGRLLCLLLTVLLGVWFTGLTDQHGSLLSTVSETGVLSALRTYDPYGAARPGSADPTGVGFTGEWRNATGLYRVAADTRA